MSSSIDQRVVQMQFDNAQFEQGVRTTMDSLKNLDRALQMTGSTSSGLDNVQRSLSQISTEPIENGCSRLSSILGTISSIGSTAFDAITTGAKIATLSVAALATGMTALITGQIISGGTKRAANIEQAKFQLKGLGIEWSEISEDLDYAVKDTAYGLDEAAVAAAQLVASQVSTGDEMKTALRAISGAAAMTNSSYSDMARIFTTVAGNGRLMGDQLNQLGGRGLNAAAKLADYFNGVNDGSIDATDSVKEMVATITNGTSVSEADIREFTSKGLINFELFAAAMDSCFGEHAKKANETFDGAFANMKAALSRIGADFIAPLRDGERVLFLGLRAIFDSVRKGLNTVGEFADTSTVQAFVDNVQRALEIVGHTLEEIGTTAEDGTNIVRDFFAAFSPLNWSIFATGLDVTVQTMRALLDFAHSIPNKEIAEFANSLSEIVYVIGQDFAASVRPGLQVLGNIAAVFMNLAKLLASIIAPALEAFFQVFSGFGFSSLAGGLRDFTGQLVELSSKLTLSEEHTNGIRNAFTQLFTVIAKIGSGMSLLIAPLADFVKYLGENVWAVFLGILERLGGIDLSGLSVGSVFEFLANGLSSFLGVIKEFLNPAELVLSVFDYFGEKIGALASGVDLIDVICNALRNLGDVVKAVIDAFKNTGVFQTLADVFREVASALNFENLTVALETSIGVGLATAIGKLGAVLSRFMAFLDKIGNSDYNVKNVLGLGPLVDQLKNSLIAFQASVHFNNILKIAGAIGILALSFSLLGKLNWDEIGKGAASLTMVGAALVAVTGALSAMSERSLGGDMAKTLPALGSVIAVAVAVGIMAAAFKSLSGIDSSGISSAIAGIAACSIALIGIANVLSKLDKGIMLGAMALVSVSASLILVALSFKLLSTVPMEKLGNGIAGMIVVVSLLSGLMAVLNTMGPRAILGATAVAVISGAMVLMAVSMAGMALIPYDRLRTAMIGLLGTLLVVSASLVLISAIGPKIIAGGLALTLASAGILSVAGALLMLSNISSLGITNALVGLSLSLMVLSVALYAMKGSLVGAAALTVASAALLLLVPALAALSAIPVGPLVSGVVILVAGLAALGLVAKVLAGPLIVLAASFLAVGAAMALFGVGVALVGAGLATALAGLSAFIMLLLTNANIIAETIQHVCVASITALGALGVALANLVVGFVTELALHTGELAEAGTTLILALLEAIRGSINGIVEVALELIEGFLSSLADHMPAIAESGMAIILSLLIALRNGIGPIVQEAFNIMVSFATGLAKGIRDNRERVVAAAMMIGAAIVSAIVDTLADIIALIPGVGEDIAEQMRGMSDDLEDAANDAMDKAEKAYEEKTGNMVDSTKKMADGTEKAIKDSGPKLGAASSDVGEMIADMFGFEISDLPNMTEEQLDAIQQKIDASGIPIDVREMAEQVRSDYASGIDGMSDDTAKEMSEVDRQLDSAGSGAYNSGERTGSNYGAGLKAGLLSSGILEAAESIASSVNGKFASIFEEHSPSKVAYRIGAFYSEGLALGISDMGEVAVHNAEDTAFGVIGATAGLAAQIAAEMDAIQAAPTVTPVLDTSSVTEGMALLDAMMMQRQIAMAGWAGAQSYYDPVASARVDNQPQTVYNTYLDYDAGSDATDMVRDMTRKFKMANALGG